LCGRIKPFPSSSSIRAQLSKAGAKPAAQSCAFAASTPRLANRAAIRKDRPSLGGQARRKPN
jgi:hypothetical protein